MRLFGKHCRKYDNVQLANIYLLALFIMIFTPVVGVYFPFSGQFGPPASLSTALTTKLARICKLAANNRPVDRQELFY